MVSVINWSTMAISHGMQRQYLPPANEGYVFTGVCLSTGGVPGQVPPWAGTPPACTPPLPQFMLGYGQHAGGTHPSGMNSC